MALRSEPAAAGVSESAVRTKLGFTISASATTGYQDLLAARRHHRQEVAANSWGVGAIICLALGALVLAVMASWHNSDALVAVALALAAVSIGCFYMELSARASSEGHVEWTATLYDPDPEPDTAGDGPTHRDYLSRQLPERVHQRVETASVRFPQLPIVEWALAADTIVTLWLPESQVYVALDVYRRNRVIDPSVVSAQIARHRRYDRRQSVRGLGPQT
jgi:hypothetical protein